MENKRFNTGRREFFTATVPATLAALSAPALFSQEVPAPPEDITLREIDLLALSDGVIMRESGIEIPMPLIWTPQTDLSAVDGLALNSTFGGLDIPTFPAPALVQPGQNGALSFNLYLPPAGQTTLFEQGPGGTHLRQQFASKGVRSSFGSPAPMDLGDPDGTVDKDYNYQLARFDAYGIIHDKLEPTCVSGNVQGIWIKLDVLGWLLGSFNRWKTYAEGSLGSVDNHPGQYQFYWTKPRICGTGTSNRNAIYNGLLTMFRQLVTELAGVIGRTLDDLLGASAAISGFLADALVKWIGVPGSAGGTTAPASNADFSIAASPSSATVRRTQTATYTIQVKPANGFTAPVALTASGRTGSTVSFSPNTLNGGGTSHLTVRTASTSPLGVNEIVVTGKSGSISHTQSLNLVIQS